MQHHIRKKHFLQFTNILMHIRQLKKTQNIDCDNDNYVDALFWTLPEVAEQILSRAEEQMPSLPVQSQSEEQQPPKV